MTGMYHGSQDRITTITGTICLTSDYRAAEEYALHKEGQHADTGLVHVITLDPAARIADEDDLHALAHLAYSSEYVYEIADDQRVRDALAAAGYAGVSYDDQTIDGTAHDTTLVWDLSTVALTDVEVVQA